MSDSTDITAIRRASPDDLDLAAATLAAAFEDDPIFSWCIPDAPRRRRILPAFFRLIGRTIDQYDEIYLAEGGVAMWVPPGSPVVPAAAGERFESGLAELLGDAADRTFELVATMDEHHPHEDHHYLWFLGVAPAQQGRGVGSSLLRRVLATADRREVPAYLEATSKDNVRLYERHGFEIVDELRAAGSPTLWAMWRPAAAA